MVENPATGVEMRKKSPPLRDSGNNAKITQDLDTRGQVHLIKQFVPCNNAIQN